jgi:hypothetical protein
MWLDHRAETSLPTPTDRRQSDEAFRLMTRAVDPQAAVAEAKRELIIGSVSSGSRFSGAWATICRAISWPRSTVSAGR